MEVIKFSKVYIVGTGLDITEQIEVKTASDRHYKLMNQLFENSPLGIVMIDENSKIKRVNNGFKTMYGYESGEVIGQDINDLVAKDDVRAEADSVSRRAFEGTSSQFESVRYTKEGKKLPVLISTVPVSCGDKVISVYGIYTDLTPQKDLEEQITDLLISERKAHEKAQNSLKENDILLQEVHHRVKNNLAVIAGLLDLQLLDETDQEVFKKLSEVQSRIFSIAKIHETLYQQSDIVHLRFDKYLNFFVKFLPQQGFNRDLISDVEVISDKTVLNLNQAVPAGLIINELINILLPESGQASLSLELKSVDEEVERIVSGTNLQTQNYLDYISSDKYQYKLVDILASQLGGEIDVDVS